MNNASVDKSIKVGMSWAWNGCVLSVSLKFSKKKVDTYECSSTLGDVEASLPTRTNCAVGMQLAVSMLPIRNFVNRSIHSMQALDLPTNHCVVFSITLNTALYSRSISVLHSHLQLHFEFE